MPNPTTLRHSRHAGLDPHFDRSSFDDVNQFDAAKLLSCFEDGLANYRRMIEHQILAQGIS